RTVLQLYSNLSDQEQQIVTPHRLKEMGEAKVHHIISIIETYHPELFREYKLNAKRLREYNSPLISAKKEHEEALLALCSLFNALPPGQRGKLLQMTQEEVHLLDKETKKELLMYLMAHTKEQDELQTQLLRLAADQPVSDQLITTLFNSLEHLQQGEWRQMKLVGSTQKEAILSTIETEVSAVEQKLNALKKRIEKLSDRDYLGYSARLESMKQERAALESECHAEQITFDSIKMALESLPARPSGHKEENLNGLKINIAGKLGEMARLDKTIAETEEKRDQTAQKISKLRELKQEWEEKLHSLQRLSGKELPVVQAYEESKESLQIIDTIISKAITEIATTTEKAILSMLEKKMGNQAAFKESVELARALFTEMLALHEEHLAVT
ncbi:MAG: hypothetical protein JSR46_09700, partial [Verrucomicrobia bacterium]|nr:hypothetical protein [Verrucomicrobiota bacterium]